VQLNVGGLPATDQLMLSCNILHVLQHSIGTHIMCCAVVGHTSCAALLWDTHRAALCCCCQGLPAAQSRSTASDNVLGYKLSVAVAGVAACVRTRPAAPAAAADSLPALLMCFETPACMVPMGYLNAGLRQALSNIDGNARQMSNAVWQIL
jgi:hypothetical protein